LFGHEELFLLLDVIFFDVSSDDLSFLVGNVSSHSLSDVPIFLLLVELCLHVGGSNLLKEESIDMISSKNVLSIELVILSLLLQPELLSYFPYIPNNHLGNVRDES